jgi:hypothetical protein
MISEQFPKRVTKSQSKLVSQWRRWSTKQVYGKVIKTPTTNIRGSFSGKRKKKPISYKTPEKH